MGDDCIPNFWRESLLEARSLYKSLVTGTRPHRFCLLSAACLWWRTSNRD